MPRPALRSRSLVRRKVRVPSGRLETHYRERRPSKPACSNCAGQLSGVPRGRPIDIKRLPISSKRPNRMFGGQLCSKCSREEIKSRILRPGQPAGGNHA